MRKIISWEGAEKVPHVIFEKDALTWGDEPLPLVWNFQHNDVKALLGNASDLRREEDGSITAELTFNDTEQGNQAQSLAEHGDIAFTTWSNDLIFRRDKAMKVVSNARIRSVSAVLTDQVGWS